MATIVVHGTMTGAAAHQAGWWWNSWHDRGFLAAVAGGMNDGGVEHDVWRVRGRPVSEIAELSPRKSWLLGRFGLLDQHKGHFMWTGADLPMAREGGASHLAEYLNAVHALSPQEPLRVIAHSHGCNVVKMAIASDKLHHDVHIDQAVFLACPHLHGPSTPRPGESLRASVDAKTFASQMALGRFGSVLNLFSSRDTVQTRLAQMVQGPAGARVVDFVPQLAGRVGVDQAVRTAYADFEIATEDTGTAAHTAMHGSRVGYLVGRWLAGGDFAAMLGQIGRRLFPVPKGDHG